MPPLLTRPITVAVPATSANLGPGFDVLGLAVGLHNWVTVEVIDRQELGDCPPLRITIAGDGVGDLAHDTENLVFRSVACLFARAAEPVPALLLHLKNHVPVGRGLGSSAAAIVGGLVAANTLLCDRFSREELLECALTLEPHPDNVAAALYGGLTIAVCREGALPIVRTVLPAAGLKVVLFIPEGSSSTAHARGILPREVSRADAVFNMARTTLLVQALATGDWGVLRTAMQDRLHQPQRGQLFPALPALIEAANAAGAYGAALSGSGSTVLALASAERSAGVAAAMLGLAPQFALRARTIVTEVAPDGAALVDCHP